MDDDEPTPHHDRSDDDRRTGPTERRAEPDRRPSSETIDLTSGDAEPPTVRRRREWIRGELGNFATESVVLVTESGRLVSAVASGLADDLAGEPLDPHLAALIHPDDRPRIFELAERARRTPGFQESIRVRARHRDGTWRVLDARVYDASSKSALEGAVLRVRDITEEHTAAVSAADVDRFAALAEMLPHGILSADRDGNVAYANQAALELFDLSDREIRGPGWRARVVPDDLAGVDLACRNVISAGLRQQVVFRVDTDLYVRWAHATLVPLGGQEDPTGWIATVTDITERQSVEGRLAHQATHDALTGLPNRSLLTDRLARSLTGLQRDVASVSVAFLDLDGFKAVNDTHGHSAGDTVLVEVARRLRQVTREVDTVARLGGDEFVVVCESVERAELQGLLGRIHAALAEPIAVRGSSVSVAASIGFAVTTDISASPDEIIAAADQAMYRAKRRPRTVG